MRLDVKLTEKEVALIRSALDTHEWQNEGLFSISQAASLRCLRLKLDMAEKNCGSLASSNGSLLCTSSLLHDSRQSN